VGGGERVEAVALHGLACDRAAERVSPPAVLCTLDAAVAKRYLTGLEISMGRGEARMNRFLAKEGE
jgi:hypothetical protein